MKKLLFNLFCTLLFLLGVYYAYDSFYMINNNKTPVDTPNFMNMPYEKAVALADKLNLKIEVVAKEHSKYIKGNIYLQVPEAGSIIKNTRTIKIAVSEGPYQIQLNDFRGLELKNAKDEILYMGLTFRTISYVNHELPFNTVIAVYPDNNEVLYKMRQISLLVSAGRGDKEVVMPNLIGLDYEKAVELLNASELISNEPRYVENKWLPEGSVVQQSYVPDKKLVSGSFVDLTISRE